MHAKNGRAAMLATRANLIWTLFWHRFVPRNRSEGFKLLWVFLEPAAQLALILGIFTFIGRNGGYGISLALFLLTGIAMLSIVTRGMMQVGGAVQALRSPRRLPEIGVFADPLAALLFTLFTAAIYTGAIAWGIGHWQHVDVIPVAPFRVLEALAAAGLLAFGLGMIRGYSARFAPVVMRALGILSRALLFISGVFYMPSYMPPFIRDWLYWNPVLHVVELMRRGVYGDDYPSLVLDELYLGACALGLASFGMVLLWADRRRLLE
ncbi:MAG: ABC transporter permease [Pseudomonadota bacterium]